MLYWQKRNRDCKQTETMKIMASFSRDISLQAAVNFGLPMGINSNPGGGVFSVVTCG
jgi:hypothetical protein